MDLVPSRTMRVRQRRDDPRRTTVIEPRYDMDDAHGRMIGGSAKVPDIRAAWHPQLRIPKNRRRRGAEVRRS